MNIMLSREVKIKSIDEMVSFIKTTHRIEDGVFIKNQLLKVVETKQKTLLKEGLMLGVFKHKNSFCFTLDTGADRGIILTIPSKEFN